VLNTLLKSAKLQLLYAIVVYLPIEKRKEDNMETLFNELEEYLSSNTIQYTSDRENYTVSFDGKTYEFFPPNDDGYFFDEDFRWDNETTEYDGYVFRFGGVWYTIEKGQERDPKLNRVKWRGQSEVAGFSSNFLGVHGSFELLNGTSLYSDWVKKAKFLRIERLGIVEKGTLAGALKFQNACKSVGIIPVFGLEVPVKDEKKDISFTYKIYAQNEKGWQHLLAINKIINCDSSGKFATPKDMSEHMTDVFIIFDPKTIDYTDVPILLRNKHNVFWQADTVEYAKFNRDTEYLTNFEAFYKSKMKPVALCDAFYIEPEYYILRETVNKIGKKVNHKSYNQYFKDEVTYMEELLSLFGDQSVGEAFYLKARENMDMIAKSCNFEIPTDSRHLPRYEMTKEEKEKYGSNEDMFDSLIYEGLENKPELLEDYSEDVLVERIERESDTIKFGDVVDYFLILRDIVNWCKGNDILLGGGRGSSAGCLISYLFGIVNTNALKFNLLFERFLNKGRVKVSLPDVDTDVPGEKRPLVKRYMENRFGETQVCSVGTYTTLQIKQAINDVGKIYGASIPTLRRISKTIEDVKTEEDFLKLAHRKEEIAQFVNKYPEMMNVVFLLLGQQKAASIHACAMMIFPKEKTMYEWCPVRKVDNLVVSEWEGGEMDEAGFLKEDILGIEQLDKFTDILTLIEKNTGKKINLYTDIEYDDPEVYRYFANGWLSDIFQFSAKGLSSYTQKMKPKNMDDVIAALSLFRPGPMENGFHMDYIALKNGEKEPLYPIGTEEILKDTYGLLVTQEQIMNICNQLADFDLVTCDKVRKALGKKKLDVLLPLKAKFIEGYVNKFGSKGATKESAEHLWDQMEEFAKYSFNRCISGSCKFLRNACSKSKRQPTIEEMYLIRNDIEFAKANNWLPLRSKYMRLGYGECLTMCEDGRIRTRKIKDIRFAGVRQTYKITLEEGRYISVTDNHKFPTQRGKVMCKDLVVGEDSLFVQLPYEKTDSQRYNFTDFRGKNWSKGHPECLNSRKGHIGFVKTNGESAKFESFREQNGGFGICKICGKECRLEIHHVDGNRRNNENENLISICASCHKKIHYREFNRTRRGEKGYPSKLMRIVSIQSDKVENVYDVEVDDPNHNFCTDQGIVTCNSHAAAYAINAYNSLWLKVHYPLEFWSVALSRASKDDFPRYINEMNQTEGIEIKPVNINKSDVGIVGDKKSNSVYWALNATQQVGEKAQEQIIKERNENGDYFSLEEFVDRHSFKGSSVNKSTVENLIYSGAFDEMDETREFSNIFSAREYMLGKYREKNRIKIDREKDEYSVAFSKNKIGKDWWWLLQQKNKSGFAFFDYKKLTEEYLRQKAKTAEYYDVDDLQNYDGSTYKMAMVGGYVLEVEEKESKTGAFASLLLENNYKFLRVVIFPVDYMDKEKYIQSCKKNILLLTGKVSFDRFKEEYVIQANGNSQFIKLGV
jgi:DNA polymerase-3 subunit alpha